jgi:hypothetical protein
MHKKKLILTIAVAIFVIALTFSVLIKTDAFVSKTSSPAPSGQSTVHASTSGVSSQPTYIPLTSAEKEKVANTILSSEFVKAIPNDNPISLTFFKFQNGQRIWQDKFLIGKDQLLSSGTAGIKLTLHSKYIEQLNGNNLCEIIKQANKNRDLGFESSYSKITLLMKYAGLLKYRDCFGF